MRKFYLFNLKEEIYNYYYDKPDKLYKVIDGIYNDDWFDKFLFLQLINYNEDISCYIKSVYYKKCGSIYLLKNKKEKTAVNIKKSVIIITSSVDNPDILIFLNKLFKYMFVIDFKNSDYFFLNNIKYIYYI